MTANQNVNASMKRRAVVVALFLCVIMAPYLIYRIGVIQFINGEEYSKKAADQQLQEVEIPARRGSIYDRNGKVLAKSATVWNVFISPADIKDEDQIPIIAAGLSKILDVPEEKIIAMAQNKKNYYEVVSRKIEKPTADAVTQFALANKINCIHLEEDNKRYYPYGNFAATILGFTNYDGKGAYGIESYYNKALSGTPGQVVSAKTAKNTEMPFGYKKRYEPVDGNSIELTIDEVVQHFLEKHLEIAVAEYKVYNRATGIIMDVNTGEILAMATKPDFDPNNPYTLLDENAFTRLEGLTGDEYKKKLQEEQYAQWRNKAISDPYEPGSVFKLIMAAAGLETGVINLDSSSYYCPGYHIVAGKPRKCWKTIGHGQQDFEHALMNSCNPAFMMIGEKLGPSNYYKYFSTFGFTAPTGIDLPAEADGIYHSEKRLGESNGSYLASASFGQTFKITPIQMISGVAAAINGGYLMEPYVVKKILDPQGNVISTTEPKVIRQTVSSEISHQVSLLGEQVVSAGSGKNAYVPGFRIGGKTGTSEKIDQQVNGVVVDKIASFIGYAPADDPKIIVLVLLDEPKSGSSFGSVLAAPVVGAIMNDTLPYLGVQPQYSEEEQAYIDIKTPYVLGLKPHEATATLTRESLKSKVLGDGTSIIKQVPAPSSPIPKGATVILYTEEEISNQTVTVPDVVGAGGQQANRMILNAGLNIKISGAGIEGAKNTALRQSPEAGTEVPVGTVVAVEFINNEQVE